MIEDKRLKAEGVKQLSSYSSGRRYLASLREKHKVDLAQPGSEIYDRVWKRNAIKAQADRERAIKKTEAIKEEHEARKAFEERKNDFSAPKGKIFGV